MKSDSDCSFAQLGLDPWLCSIVQCLGWLKPSPIQRAAIPVALKRQDIIGIAETGSGKTGAFLLPIIQDWAKSGRPTGFALLLVPTRELAKQLSDEAIRLGRCDADKMDQGSSVRVVRLVGGEDMVEQALQLAWHRHHMIIATPGRLVDHMRQTPSFAQQQLSTVRHLVLDEADRMLNMAFAEDLDTILNHFQKPASTKKNRKKKRAAEKLSLLDRISQAKGEHPPPNRISLSEDRNRDKFAHPQTHLYSATMTKDVVKLRRAALAANAVLVTCFSDVTEATVEHGVTAPNQTTVVQAAREINTNKSASTKTGFPPKLFQYCLPLRSVDKPAVLDWLLEQPLPRGLTNQNTEPNSSQTIVFCKRCQEARLVCEFLRARGHSTVPLTGRMEHAKRKQALADFLDRKVRILVATDVASRGLDMPNVQLVINYSVPLSEKTYRHRIGRTARAGQPGVAVTLITRDVAPSFLELEAALVPYLPRGTNGTQQDETPCIPRWPVPLPGPSGKHGLLSRRRLADEAWSKAGKLVRTQDAERRKALSEDQNDLDESEDEDDSSDGGSGSEFSEGVHDHDQALTDSDPDVEKKEADEKKAAHLDAVQTGNMPLATSGLAGIQAARQTWRALTREKRKRRRERQAMRDNQRETMSKGWGLRALGANADERLTQHSADEFSDEDDDTMDTDHLRFDETLKTKYAKINTK